MDKLYVLVGKRLKEARENMNISLETAGNYIGAHKSTILRWENGKTKKINLATIEKLAHLYNVNPAWLSGKDVYKYDNAELINFSSPRVVSIPILGIVKAGYDYLAEENWIGTIDLEKNIADSGEYFALKVRGDSMAPIFFEGDIVILKKQNDCENNEVAVVIVNGNEGTLKKVKKTDVGIILQSFNPAYTPVMYTNKEIIQTPIIIAGVFYELRRKNIKL